MKDLRLKATRSTCPVNVALEVLGDGWSLLIVRDLMLKGRRTYQAMLAAEEGIATNILAHRLRRLESVGILSKRPDPVDARRRIYRLTEAGIALAPLVVEMILWSAAHFHTAAPAREVRRMRDHRHLVLAEIRKEWETTA